MGIKPHYAGDRTLAEEPQWFGIQNKHIHHIGTAYDTDCSHKMSSM